jgi:uncharacterized SAM-binding protein YcdF (DUF218 family)
VSARKYCSALEAASKTYFALADFVRAQLKRARKGLPPLRRSQAGPPWLPLLGGRGRAVYEAARAGAAEYRQRKLYNARRRAEYLRSGGRA